MKSKSIWLNALVASTVLMAAGCGGSDGDETVAGAPAPAPAPAAPAPAPAAAAAVLTGVAATGAALPNAKVTITDSTGESPCVETGITTNGLGSYTCTLKTGKVAPFFIVVTDPTGNSPALVSVSTVTPAPGAALTVNATPLTTAIVAQLAADGNAMSVVNGKTVDAAALKAVTDNVVAQLAPVLASINAPAGYDPFATSITAATAAGTGNTADLVLDVVKVVTDPASGKLALTTIDNPTPVPLATATTSGTTVAAPDPGVSSLSQAAQIAAAKFTACFALPVAQRALNVVDRPSTEGGPEVDQVGEACEDFVSDASNAGHIDYLHNGYSAGQQFYGILTSEQMTGATFSVPEIMAFYPKSATAAPDSFEAYDRAVMNIRYIDSKGNPGSTITLAAKLPGTASATRPTDWWLVGNQQPVDVTTNMIMRRVEQLNPANTTKPSTFQVGFLVGVNAKGPGSVHPGNGSTLAAARVSGPGLPGNGAAGSGLVFKVSPNSAVPSMDLFSKNGSLTTGALCGNNTTTNCPLVWLQRTMGVTGSAATTVVSNPNSLLWAQPLEGFDISKMVKGARYKVELFYGTDTAPLYTLTKTFLNDAVPATVMVNLPWNAAGPKTIAALDPNGAFAGAQSALELDWVQNPAAQQMLNVGATIDGVGSYGPNVAIAPGATSATLTYAVPAMTVGNPPTRQVKFNYRTTDGTSKSSVFQWN
ncbi:hypothetical protein [Ramlibacter algicola]|uniref:Carboxypeptidase regulatory-like domain-containing protein n=1 Tax=Ramlibacter algicola TaxID=2795217 RepID=A0A934UQU2_9BURK|nr:hypothetical protein [Ramlibacter algicola]MBK0391867.1 hypothetical protein [Ramlibacter algicola]